MANNKYLTTENLIQILKGINFNQDRTIKDHGALIVKGIEELIDYVITSENNNTFSSDHFKQNLDILKRTYEILERKLLIKNEY